MGQVEGGEDFQGAERVRELVASYVRYLLREGAGGERERAGEGIVPRFWWGCNLTDYKSPTSCL